MRLEDKLVVGWREWCALPDLSLPGIKVKVDTGAATSSLHAYEIKPFRRRGELWVRFGVHPLQRDNEVVVDCEALVVDHRPVRSSNGEQEERYVVRSRIELGGWSWDIDLSLTNRDIMKHRMLLGRRAMSFLLVDPKRSYCQGRWSDKEVAWLY